MNMSDKPPSAGGREGGGGYTFTTPYPRPEYQYPTAHERTRSSLSLSLPGYDARKNMSDKDRPPPSPTPSEIEEMNQPFIPGEIYTLAFYKRPKVILIISVVTFFTILTALIAIYAKQIEHFLQPAAKWMRDLKFGFLIPIAILFVISFPPLFGHEIVAVLCGNVWGLWPGFAIVSAGTVLGEIGNFYAFKYVFKNRAARLEETSWWYACLASTVRTGGFKIAVMARLSVIPGHFTTAIFATCGMNIFVFTIAAILSMPKQFATVYLGVLLEEADDPNAKKDPKSKIISDVVLALSIVVTIVAMWYIVREMRKSRLTVVRERRAKLGKRGGKLSMESGEEEGRLGVMRAAAPVNDSTSSLVSTDVFNPNASAYNLHGGYDRSRASGQFEPTVSHPQKWDSSGHAIDDHDDPYAYNSYPPPATTKVASPPLENPHPYTPTPRAPPVLHVQAPSTDSVNPFEDQQPGSPFHDSNAVPYPTQNAPTPSTAAYPSSAPRYTLQDPGFRSAGPRQDPPGHNAEATDATFYSAHSRFESSEG